MQDTVELLLGLNDLHWQGSVFQWLFYAAILLTLIFERRRRVRIVFGWVPALLLVLMFNPLCVKLLNLAGLLREAYFARLFSFMPLMYVIARGFMFLTAIGKPWLKLACVILVCTAISLVGKNIYHESWLTKAENLQKVPGETLEILETIKAEGEWPVSIAAIDESSIYLRQVDDVIMPYGRRTGDLGVLLSQRSVDVNRVMEIAGRQDVDYIMVRRTRRVLASFLKYRHQPFAMTQNYVLFKVEGVPRISRRLNEKRQVVSQTYLDAAGNPTAGDTGYTTVRYEYDSWSRVTRESYYDAQDNLIAAVGEGEPVRPSCLEFCQRTSGARKDGSAVSFETQRKDNHFNAVLFQLGDGATGEYLLSFGAGYGAGEVSGEYVHQLPSGLYRLMFKGNTNLADECVYSLEYLTKGETLYYSYHVDAIQEKTVGISNLYIGREKP